MPTTRSTTYSTQITHVGNGGALAAGAMSAASDVSTALSSTNLARYAYCDLQLFCSATTSVSSLSNTILCYRRDINFDSTNDELVPSTVASIAYRQKLIGAFTVAPWTAASTGYFQLCDVPLADECEFYIENTLSAGIAAGWTLKVRPKSDQYA